MNFLLRSELLISLFVAVTGLAGANQALEMYRKANVAVKLLDAPDANKLASAKLHSHVLQVRSGIHLAAIVFSAFCRDRPAVSYGSRRSQPC
jgi:hypothetical protein